VPCAHLHAGNSLPTKESLVPELLYFKALENSGDYLGQYTADILLHVVRGLKKYTVAVHRLGQNQVANQIRS